MNNNICKAAYHIKARQSELCPRLTSIPHHLALLNEMVTLKGTMSHSARQLEDTLKDELNRRGLGGNVSSKWCP